MAIQASRQSQAEPGRTSMPPPGVVETNMATVVRAVASEVADLAVAADELQSLVGSLLSDPLAMIDSRAMEQGQALDSIVQRLQALQTFLSALAPSVQSDWSIDADEAANMVLLASLAQKLSGHAVEQSREEIGDCDFF